MEKFFRLLRQIGLILLVPFKAFRDSILEPDRDPIGYFRFYNDEMISSIIIDSEVPVSIRDLKSGRISVFSEITTLFMRPPQFEVNFRLPQDSNELHVTIELTEEEKEKSRFIRLLKPKPLAKIYIPQKVYDQLVVHCDSDIFLGTETTDYGAKIKARKIEAVSEDGNIHSKIIILESGRFVTKDGNIWVREIATFKNNGKNGKYLTSFFWEDPDTPINIFAKNEGGDITFVLVDVKELKVEPEDLSYGSAWISSGNAKVNLKVITPRFTLVTLTSQY